jgi:hypothetical protein
VQPIRGHKRRIRVVRSARATESVSGSSVDLLMDSPYAAGRNIWAMRKMRPSTNSPLRLASAMRNSSKSCATYTLSKLKYGTCRTMATITAVSSSPPHVTSVR